jgi:MoxR-like ATPase
MSDSVQEVQDRVQREGAAIEQLLGEVRRVIVGQKYLLERMVIGLLTRGHLLLEGVPGLAKTLAVRSLAGAVHGSFRRIQFTPDLLPADLTGTLIYNQKDGTFVPRKGPLFANFVLADEINRAPAKVQSALLEAMQERQVTIGDTTYPLPSPFLVLATQNPIEQEGTYPLPEAQVDRFLLKLHVDYPSSEDERQILDRMTGSIIPEVKPVVDLESIERARTAMHAIYVDDRIKDYAVRLVQADATSQGFQARSRGARPVRRLAARHDGPDHGGPGARLSARARIRFPRGHQGRRPRRDAAPSDPLVRGGGRVGHVRRSRAARIRRGRGPVNPRDVLRRVRRLEIRTRRLVDESLAGSYHSVFKGRGVEFAEVREYEPGDDVRTIDWNVSAKMGHPFVKKFTGGAGAHRDAGRGRLGVGPFGTAPATKLETAAEIAALLAFSAIRNNDRVGLLLFTDRIERFVPPRKGRQHGLRVLRELMAFETAGTGTDFKGALEVLRRW